MVQKAIVISILIMTALVSLSVAEEQRDALAYQYQDMETGRTLLIPANIVKFDEAVYSEIDKKQLAEAFGTDIKAELYDRNGRLEQVLYADDISVKYSYEFDESGELVTCKLASSKGVTITFTEKSSAYGISGGDSGGHPSNTNVMTDKPGGDKGGDVPGPGPVIIVEIPGKPPIIYRPKNNPPLEDIARKPIQFDFDGLGKAMDDTAAARNKARDEYLRGTDPYYVMVLRKLRDSVEKANSEGIDVAGYVKAADDGDATWKDRREAVEKAVTAIREAAAQGAAGGETTDSFLIFEARQRADIIDPNKEIYDKEIAHSEAHLNTLIEELVESNIAFYLNKKKAVIQAVVNLRKKSAQKPQ